MLLIYEIIFVKFEASADSSGASVLPEKSPKRRDYTGNCRKLRQFEYSRKKHLCRLDFRQHNFLLSFASFSFIWFESGKKIKAKAFDKRSEVIIPTQDINIQI